jgi:hypothetical protein
VTQGVVCSEPPPSDPPPAGPPPGSQVVPTGVIYVRAADLVPPQTFLDFMPGGFVSVYDQVILNFTFALPALSSADVADATWQADFTQSATAFWAARARLLPAQVQLGTPASASDPDNAGQFVYTLSTTLRFGVGEEAYRRAVALVPSLLDGSVVQSFPTTTARRRRDLLALGAINGVPLTRPPVISNLGMVFEMYARPDNFVPPLPAVAETSMSLLPVYPSLELVVLDQVRG